MKGKKKAQKKMQELWSLGEERMLMLTHHWTSLFASEEGQGGTALRKGQAAAATEACKQPSKEEERVHWVTYRATIKREGHYFSNTAGEGSIHGVLVRPLLAGGSVEGSFAVSKGVRACMDNWKITMESTATAWLSPLSDSLEKTA